MEKSTQMQNSDTIPIEGKTFIYCFRCGTKTMIPPRTRENLEHIREAEAESDRMHRITTDAEERVAFTRVMLCPSCNNVMVCGDRYTKIYPRQNTRSGDDEGPR